MKRDNDFYFFLSFITLYTILLLWYSYFSSQYPQPEVAGYTRRALNEHTLVAFLFQVVLAFPLGIINWLNADALNVVFYFLGGLFYSFLFYKLYFKKMSSLLSLLLLLNLLAAIFLAAFFLDNPHTITEARM